MALHYNEEKNNVNHIKEEDEKCLRQIYMDYNATTPLAPTVVDIITSTLTRGWGNPSSSHSEGLQALKIIQEARSNLTEMINGGNRDEEIIFMSGGTEANNSVIFSAIEYFKGWSELYTEHDKPHIITSRIEHDSILNVLKHYETKGVINVTYVDVCPSLGHINPQHVINAVTMTTVLVTIMMANNETGAIQPIQDICTHVKAFNFRERIPEGLPLVQVHTDAAQAIGKIDVDVDKLGVDYLTIVGHKFYGPRIGALWVRSGASIYPMMFGGGQESGQRSGTENTCMIAGLGEAGRLVAENLQRYNAHYKKLGWYLKEELIKLFENKISFNIVSEHSLPNTLNISLKGGLFTGSKVLSLCKHLQASVGAACHSDKGDEPSSILIAQGIPLGDAKNAIRLSLGRETTTGDIDTIVKDIFNAASTLDDSFLTEKL